MRPSLPVAILLICSSLFGCSEQRLDPGPVFLVTIDTLRADHLGAYGYPLPTSPFLDRLALEGVRFERAISSMATTVPAHVSIFTSRYPLQVGVRRNGDVLPDSVYTLAEHLSDNGYTTAAFVATKAHFAVSNLDQGFGVFDEPLAGRRRVEQVLDLALDWLETRARLERLFLWIHLFDPHSPVDPPSSYEAMMSLDGASKEAYRRFLREAHHVEPLQVVKDLKLQGELIRGVDRFMLEDYLRLYDAEIRFVDDQLGRFYEALRRYPAFSRALWIVTSDHGEGLGNHGWMGHGKHIYNEQVRVPLILHHTDAPSGGRVVSEVVELLDLWPTVAEHLGLESPDKAVLLGRPLGPLYLNGHRKSDASRSLAFSVRRSYQQDPRGVWPSIPEQQLNYERGETYALQSGRYKYLLRTEGRDELFDLAADPYETRNLIESHRPVARDLRRRIRTMVAGFRSEAPDAPLSAGPETQERLRALGYLQ